MTEVPRVAESVEKEQARVMTTMTAEAVTDVPLVVTEERIELPTVNVETTVVTVEVVPMVVTGPTEENEAVIDLKTAEVVTDLKEVVIVLLVVRMLTPYLFVICRSIRPKRLLEITSK